MLKTLRLRSIVTLFLYLLKELAYAAEGLGDVLGGIAVGCANEALAAVSEGGAGDYCHSLGIEQPFAKLLT